MIHGPSSRARARHSLAAVDLLYVSPTTGYAVSSLPSLFRLAATGALVLALGLTLSACGRRGPLESPPGVINTPQGAIELDSEGRPIAPPGQKKRLPIDWLLD
jgi:predicted small lipoprotein YifL